MFSMTDSGVLAAMLAAPATTALWAFLFGQRAPRATARLGAVVAGAGFVGAGAQGEIDSHLCPLLFAQALIGRSV